jgi:hypothetical protein
MTTLKQELMDLISIYFKDYIWKIDDADKELQFYEGPYLCIIIDDLKDKIYINMNDTWEKNKKRIELNIEKHINECIICNETKELIFCDECLNEHCLLCFAHIIVRNKGTPVCPFCRDGEDRVNINDGYNNALKQHRYQEALKMIQSNI